MYDESSLTTIEAAKIAGCTTRHITNLITRGELSATRKDNKYIIDKSEFYRVFPQTMKKDKETINNTIMAENSKLSLENTLLKELCKSKDKEIEFLRTQIESFARKEEKMLESMIANTKLLAHQNDNAKEESRKWGLFKRKK